MREPLTIAVAQPVCAPYDVVLNARTHAAVVREAGTRVVLFPELSLTGYELDAPAVSPDDPALAPLVQACGETAAVALVGAPVVQPDGNRVIAMLRVTGAGVDIAYRKLYPGSEESRYFCAGANPASIDIDGWRLGLGICRDTGIADQVRATAELGIDGYLAGLVHLPAERSIQEARAARIAGHYGISVAFASFAGPTGWGYSRTAGNSAIWSADGKQLACAGDDPGAVASATWFPP